MDILERLTPPVFSVRIDEAVDAQSPDLYKSLVFKYSDINAVHYKYTSPAPVVSTVLVLNTGISVISLPFEITDPP